MSSLSELKAPFSARLQGSVLGQRWQALAPRERLALVLLALFLLLVLLYLSLWRPVQQGLVTAREAYEQERALHAYMQAQAPLARSLASTPQSNLDPARLQGVVTASATEQGLTVERLDSAGDGSLEVSLQAAPFAQLLRWFVVLERQGVRIAEAGLDRSEDNLVAARLSLRVAF
mgnify:CR=1 FL=1